MSDLDWQKSSLSSGDPESTCIEVAAHAGHLYLRESDHPATVLKTTTARLTALLTRLATEGGQW